MSMETGCGTSGSEPRLHRSTCSQVNAPSRSYGRLSLCRLQGARPVLSGPGLRSSFSSQPVFNLRKWLKPPEPQFHLL